MGVGAAPRVGWWCGAPGGGGGRGEDAPAAAGAHPHPVPSPPWAAAPTPVAEAAIRRPRARGGRTCRQPAGARRRPHVSPTAGIRASSSASGAWEVLPGRWGYLPLECSREWGRVGAAAPRQRQVREHPRIAPTPVLAPRALRAVVPLGGRRVRRHPTGPQLTGPGSSNPGPPGGPGCPSRRAVRRSGRRAAPACPARRRAPRPDGQWSVPGRSPWRVPDRPFR